MENVGVFLVWILYVNRVVLSGIRLLSLFQFAGCKLALLLWDPAGFGEGYLKS